MRTLPYRIYFFALAITVFSTGNLFGQKAMVVMRDGRQISTTLRGFSSDRLISSSEKFKLDKISKVVFEERHRRRAAELF